MISVIMPVFNGEVYLRETIESVCRQTFSDWELWMVDDGSTDNTCHIMEEYADRDGRIHYINQENQGVGPARNAGLEKAQGEWIWFLDGDDLLAENAMTQMYETILQTGADLVIGNFQYYFEGTGKLSGPKQPLNGLQILRNEERIPCIHLHPILQNKIWNKMKIQQNGICFQAFRNIEDFDFYLQYLFYSESVAITDQVVCYYRIHDKSVSHTYSDSILDTIHSFEHMKKFCREKEEAEPFLKELVFDEIFHYNMVFRRLPGYRSRNQRKKILDAFIEAEKQIDYSAAGENPEVLRYARKFHVKKGLRKLYESGLYSLAYRGAKILRNQWQRRKNRFGA